MVFWGAEVEPGKPFIHRGESDEEYEGSRLHLSQATLGLDGQGKKRTVVKCKVGDGPEHLLCSLTPGVSESCSLDLLFDQDVVFSVTGSTSVHLVGYYMPLEDEGDDDDYAYDEEDSDEDDEDFEEDEDSESDVPPTGVTIEEIEDELPETPRLLQIEEKRQILVNEIPVKESKKAAKKRQKAEAAAAATVAGAAAASKSGEVREESEDEDGFPLPPKKKQAVNGSDDTPSPLTPSKKSKKKNKNKKEVADKAVAQAEKSVEGTVKQAGEENGSKDGVTEKAVGGNGAVATPVAETKVKSAQKASANRKFPNGLEIEETAMGKPDARQAKMGKKVSVYYSGKLKASGKIFDSNIGKKPFSFRLGVGEVIKGWDVGVQGMRIGDKRRITVPPAMAYGPKGVSGTIPGNSWLVFDVEMTDAAK